LLLLAFLVLRRGILVTFLALKILGYTDALDAWEGAVRHQTVQHDGMRIDVYGESSASPILIVHGVNPSGKDSLDLMRISEALAQVGYQVFVPDFVEMKRQHLEPEEALHIKSAFQFIGRDAAIACFSYGCGPALIAAADADIRKRVRFAVVFGGYFDIHEALEFVITGPESPIAYLKWVYLRANSDVVADENDRAILRKIAERQNAETPENLSADGRALLNVFTSRTPEDFRARLKLAPEGLRRRLEALSPSNFVNGMETRLILVHGINDPVIPAEQAIKLAEVAQARGLDYSLTLLRMYGHVHPILPDVGVSSLVGFYLPETVRFLKVVNSVVGAK
jgi:pimeloyl-ACP methyl ester carboxylesterase